MHDQSGLVERVIQSALLGAVAASYWFDCRHAEITWHRRYQKLNALVTMVKQHMSHGIAHILAELAMPLTPQALKW